MVLRDILQAAEHRLSEAVEQHHQRHQQSPTPSQAPPSGTAASSSQSAVAHHPPLPSRPHPAYQQPYLGIIAAGQSLGAGVQAPISKPPTIAIPHAFKLGDRAEPWDKKYNIKKPEASTLRLEPLTEPIHPVQAIVGFYPWNIAGKTPHSSMSLQVNALLENARAAPYEVVHSNVCRSGEPMSGIRKGGDKNAYEASMYEATALTRLVGNHKDEEGAPRKLEYAAVVLTHGESDAGNKEYGKQVAQLQRDYAEDLKRITGQQREPVLMLSQQHSCPPGPKDMCMVSQLQWRVQVETGNKVICAGPKYQYEYAAGAIHLPAGGYDRLGEKYGQVLYQTVIEGRPFVPLSPTKIILRDRSTIKVEFRVPVPPLCWDGHLPKPHQKDHKAWSKGRGFEIRDEDGAEVEIEGVEIGSDGTSVDIRLAKPRTRAELLHVAYAMTGGRNWFNGGGADGRLGHLCDSDPLISAGAETLECDMVPGSSFIYRPEGFANQALWDIIEPGEDLVITQFDSKKRLEEMSGKPWKEREDGVAPIMVVMSKPWHGVAGKHKLCFRHNQRNFCVSFVGKVGDEPFDSSAGKT